MAKKNRRKAGRPRKTGPRQPNGQPKRERAGPTPELLAKRRAVSGCDESVAHDQPLEVLLHRGDITLDQARAGYSFERLYLRVFGRSHPGATNYGTVKSGLGQPLTEEQERRAEEQYRAVMAAIPSHLARQVLMDTVVGHAHLPWVALPDGPGYFAPQKLLALQEALNQEALNQVAIVLGVSMAERRKVRAG